MVFIHQIDKLFVLYQKGLLIAYNITCETAQMSECYYLNKICDKNMIQINQPPKQIAFYFHDIPELDLECVDENDDADLTEDAKNFIVSKHFDLKR